ncbi:histidine phosphatase family protein [Nocardioides sp. NPDC058538]|uniref:histidine phosphatase family protein n=1 Tax=Nocardioides sp. NPDC058538 TaxID=3346542 RepID=UPI0036549A78
MAVGEALGGCAIDAMFHSPLGRAAKAAEIVAELLSLPTVEVADLAEVHHGDMAGLSDRSTNDSQERSTSATATSTSGPFPTVRATPTPSSALPQHSTRSPIRVLAGRSSSRTR